MRTENSFFFTYKQYFDGCRQFPGPLCKFLLNLFEDSPFPCFFITPFFYIMGRKSFEQQIEKLFNFVPSFAGCFHLSRTFESIVLFVQNYVFVSKFIFRISDLFASAGD